VPDSFQNIFLKHPFYFSLTFACEKARECLFLLFIIIIIFTKIQKKQHRGHRLGSLRARNALFYSPEKAEEEQAVITVFWQYSSLLARAREPRHAKRASAVKNFILTAVYCKLKSKLECENKGN